MQPSFPQPNPPKTSWGSVTICGDLRDSCLLETHAQLPLHRTHCHVLALRTGRVKAPAGSLLPAAVWPGRPPVAIAFVLGSSAGPSSRPGSLLCSSALWAQSVISSLELFWAPGGLSSRLLGCFKGTSRPRFQNEITTPPPQSW